MLQIDDLKTQNWFNQKPWLIVGTGPGLKNWNPGFLDKYNVWTINAAIDTTGHADICALHDDKIYNNDLLLNKPPKARYFLTRTTNYPGTHRQNTVFCQLKGDPDKGFTTHTRHNSSGFAWYFLGKICRKKQIFCIGIDGGTQVFGNLSENYRNHENGTDFDTHNHAMNLYQRLYKYQILKL